MSVSWPKLERVLKDSKQGEKGPPFQGKRVFGEGRVGVKLQRGSAITHPFISPECVPCSYSLTPEEFKASERRPVSVVTSVRLKSHQLHNPVPWHSLHSLGPRSLLGLSPSQLLLSSQVQPSPSARAPSFLLPYSRQPERSTRPSTSANMFNAFRLHRGRGGKREMTSK